ncbi:MAG: PKD domain-containing protein [Bacteroidota bacterium]
MRGSFKLFLTFISLFSCTCVSIAQTTVSNGNWTDGSTWQGGSVPSAGQAVTISHIVTVRNNETVNVSSVNLGAVENGTGGIIVNSGASFTLSGQLYGYVSGKKAMKLTIAGNFTAGNVNLNSAADDSRMDSITLATTGTWNSGQLLYSKTSGAAGGLITTINNTMNITGGLQYVVNTTSSTYTTTINNTGNLTVSGYVIFNNQGTSNHNLHVLGQATFNEGLNIHGSNGSGATTWYIGNASRSGKLITYGDVGMKKNDDNNSGVVENSITLRNGEFVLNGTMRLEGSNSGTVDYNEIHFDNSGTFAGLSKKFIVKGNLFPSRPNGKGKYTNVANGSAIGFYLSGASNPIFRPDENGLFKFQNIIVDATSDAILDGSLNNTNLTGTLTISAGAKLKNGSSNSNTITVNSYAGQIYIAGTLVNVNTDNVPYQQITNGNTTSQVMQFASTGAVEYYCGSGYNILTGNAFSIPKVILTGTGDKILEKSLDASSRKVGCIHHQKGTLRLGFGSYINTTIDFKLFNDPILSSNAKTLILDSATVVEVPQNFTNEPDFQLTSNPYSVFHYNMQYHATIPYQKVYAPSGTSSYGILRISDSYKPKTLEANKTIQVQNYLDIPSNLTFTIANGSKVVLLSTATMTAYIPALAGTIAYTGTGKIQVQRYIKFDSSFDYRDFASPVKSSTLKSWQDAGMEFSGFSGSSYPTYENYTFSYNEATTGSLDNGFTAPTNINNALTTYSSGKISRNGWRSVQGATGGSVINLKDEGEIFQGDVDFSLSFTAGGASRTTDDGWHLIGNPYPSAISWANVYSNRDGSDLVSNSTTNGISPTIWVYMPEDAVGSAYKDGSYTYYNANTGIGETRISTIGQYQGFWVKTYNSSTNATYNLRLKEAHKVNGTKAFLKSGETNNHLLVDVEVSDETTSDKVSFHQWEQTSTGFDQGFDIEKVGSDYTGNIQLEFAGEGKSIGLRVNALDAAAQSLRIPMWFKAATAGKQHIRFTNLDQFIEGFTCAQLIDLTTNTITDLHSTQELDFNADDLTGSERFVLVLSKLKINTAAQAASCFGTTDGAVTVKISGQTHQSAVNLYRDNSLVKTFAASTLSFTEEMLTAGTYKVEISDFASCASSIQSLSVSQPAEITGKFSVPATSLRSNELIMFSNESSNASTFQWTFGDGAASSDEQGSHSYAAAGNYLVSLKAIGENASCFKEYSEQIEVLQGTSFISELSAQGLSVSTSNGALSIQNSGNAVEVSVYLTDGKLYDHFTAASGRTVKAMPSAASCILVVSTADKVLVRGAMAIGN